MAETNGTARLSAAQGLQIGAVVATLSIVAYIMQPIQSDVRRVEANLAGHLSTEGHSGVLASIASIKTDMAAIRAEISGAERLTRAQIDAILERLDYFRGAIAGTSEGQHKVIERVARIEEAVRLSGIQAPLGPVPDDDVHCFSKCHDGKNHGGQSNGR